MYNYWADRIDDTAPWRSQVRRALWGQRAEPVNDSVRQAGSFARVWKYIPVAL
jgi:hypothetical protein